MAGFIDRTLFPWECSCCGGNAVGVAIDGIEELRAPRMSFTSFGPFISRRRDTSAAAAVAVADDEVVGAGAVGSATQKMAQPGDHNRDKGFLGTFFSGMASFLGKSNPDYSVGEIKDIMSKIR